MASTCHHWTRFCLYTYKVELRKPPSTVIFLIISLFWGLKLKLIIPSVCCRFLFFFLISHYWFKLCCTVFVGIGTLTWYRLCVCKVKQRCLHSSFINQKASMSFIFYEGLGMTALYGGKNLVCYIESLTLIEQLIRHWQGFNSHQEKGDVFVKGMRS